MSLAANVRVHVLGLVEGLLADLMVPEHATWKVGEVANAETVTLANLLAREEAGFRRRMQMGAMNLCACIGIGLVSGTHRDNLFGLPIAARWSEKVIFTEGGMSIQFRE